MTTKNHIKKCKADIRLFVSIHQIYTIMSSERKRFNLVFLYKTAVVVEIFMHGVRGFGVREDIFFFGSGSLRSIFSKVYYVNLIRLNFSQGRGGGGSAQGDCHLKYVLIKMKMISSVSTMNTSFIDRLCLYMYIINLNRSLKYYTSYDKCMKL